MSPCSPQLLALGSENRQQRVVENRALAQSLRELTDALVGRGDLGVVTRGELTRYRDETLQHVLGGRVRLVRLDELQVEETWLSLLSARPVRRPIERRQVRDAPLQRTATTRQPTPPRRRRSRA